LNSVAQPQLEALVAWAAKDRDDVVEARREYLAGTGEIHEDEAAFESRMQAFFNWYLLDRKSGTPPMTPAQRFLQAEGARLAAVEKAFFIGFTQSKHSLFEVRQLGVGLIRVREDLVKLRDAFNGDEFVVTERRRLAGLERGDLLEARLLPFGDSLHFSSAFTYHARAVRPQIWKEIKRRRKAGSLEPRPFVWELQRMALNLDRFKNIPPQTIYSFDAPFLGRRESANG